MMIQNDRPYHLISTSISVSISTLKNSYTDICSISYRYRRKCIGYRMCWFHIRTSGTFMCYRHRVLCYRHRILCPAYLLDAPDKFLRAAYRQLLRAAYWQSSILTIPISLPCSKLVIIMISSLLQWGPPGQSGPSQLPWRCGGCHWWRCCTHHQVTRSWPDANTSENNNNWYVSSLDAIVKNLKLFMALHQGR